MLRFLYIIRGSAREYCCVSPDKEIRQDLGVVPLSLPVHQDQSSLTPASQRQGLFGSHPHCCSASQSAEAVLGPLGDTASRTQSYFAFGGHLKVEGRPGNQPQEVSNSFWNGYLALRGHGRGHEIIPSLYLVLLVHESG